MINQKHRKYGHVSEGDNLMYMFEVRYHHCDAKLRHEFIKRKLNISLQDNNEVDLNI